MIKKALKKQEGFTLIEILVVIGIIAILATIVIIAINPSRQFKQARDTQRLSNINAILNAVGQNIADNKGTFTCAAGALPSSTKTIKSASGGYDMYPCIVPTYMPSIVYDPSSGSFTSTSTYDTGYTVGQDSVGRITIGASVELPSSTASVTR